MLDIGIQELLVLMVLALLVFGPDKLPDLGRRLGRAMREFRRASDEFRQTVETNLQIHEDILPPSATESTSAAAGTEAAAAPPAGAGAESESPRTLTAETATASNGHGGLEPTEPFWTSRGGRLLHRGDCAWRARVSATDRVGVKTVAEGWEQGLRPCPVCEPREATPSV